ncbi:hypothetical protein FOBRF1_006799 [Fusarium oxysporum]
MPGPEATQVLALIRATISILKSAEEVHGDADDAKSLPPAFHDVAKHLQVVCDALDIAQKQIRQRKDDSACAETKPSVEECKGKAARLENLFLKVVPSAAAETTERYREAVRELGKGSRVETLMKGIMEDVHLLLTVDDEMKAAAESQLRSLVEAMKEVSAIPPSLQDESPAFGIHNYGSGPQNVVMGNGPQHNNNGQGQQFIDSTFHGVDPFHRQAASHLAPGLTSFILCFILKAVKPFYVDLRTLTLLRSGKALKAMAFPLLSYFSQNHSTNNYGAGPQNVAAGNGSQNNNNAGGIQIIDSNIFGSDPLKDPEAERLREEKKVKKACLHSLSFPNIDARQQNIADAYPDTCDWLFATTEFQEWRDRADLPTHNGVLWIKGKPGAGKSTLMKHTLRHCLKDLDDHLVAAYFFNGRGEILEKTLLGMLQSIIYQLLDKEAALYGHFVPIFREKQKMYREGRWEWQPEQLKEFMLSEIKEWKLKPILLLIDALDECNEEDVRDVVEFLERLSIDALLSGVTLRVCLSSRHYPHVSMRKVLELIVDKNAEHQRDIATYVGEKLRIRDDDIEAEVRKKADGIFMWAVLVVSLLNKAYDEGRVEAMQRTLEDVPGGLEEVFNILLSKGDQNKAETILMLQWVLLSCRPLRPEELFAAVLGTAPPTSDTIKRRFTSSSKGLIEVRKGHTESVQFIHLSVKDFLFRNKRLQTLDQTLQPDPISASHGRLWDRCRSWIEQRDAITRVKHMMELNNNYLFLEDETEEKHVMELNNNYPFLGYAASYIFQHAEKALSGGAMRDVIVQWLRMQNDWFGRWKTFVIVFDKFSDLELFSRDAGLLYELSLRGFQILVRTLLVEKQIDVNAQGGYFGNALQAASYGGREEIVRMLLENGANINAQGGEYGNALQAASHEGKEEVVRVLLENGADVNAHAGRYGNALYAASYRGHHEIASLLLEKGADVNAQGGQYGNALQAAAFEGKEEVVRVLLEKGADINAQGGAYGNALQAASYGGREEIVRILLENGADVNAQGGEYGNALQAASYQGKEDVVRVLLEKGADVNAQGGAYGNALQAASYGGREEIVRMLLENGANINAQGGEYGNALQAAAFEGKEEVVRVLLEKGADINAQGGAYGNALYAASYKGKKEIARMLLEKGADVNAQGGEYGNALQAASYRGQENEVGILLDAWYDYISQDPFLGNALPAASGEGREEIVRALLEDGADVNAQGGYFSNALQAASYQGREEIVRILLENGADVNAQGGEYGNALQAASCRGREEIVRILLENGADVNAQGGEYGNALQAASYMGNKEIVRILQENGAKFQPYWGYVSLRLTRPWPVICLMLTGWLTVRFLRRRHIAFPGLRRLGVTALGMKAWQTFSFTRPFDH